MRTDCYIFHCYSSKKTIRPPSIPSSLPQMSLSYSAHCTSFCRHQFNPLCIHRLNSPLIIMFNRWKISNITKTKNNNPVLSDYSILWHFFCVFYTNCHETENMWQLSFWGWQISLSIMASSWIHFVVKHRISSFFNGWVKYFFVILINVSRKF